MNGTRANGSSQQLDSPFGIDYGVERDATFSLSADQDWIQIEIRYAGLPVGHEAAYCKRCIAKSVDVEGRFAAHTIKQRSNTQARECPFHFYHGKRRKQQLDIRHGFHVFATVADQNHRAEHRINARTYHQFPTAPGHLRNNDAVEARAMLQKSLFDVIKCGLRVTSLVHSQA